MIRKFLKTLIFCSILLQGPVFAEDDDIFASDEEMDGSTMEERVSEDNAVALYDSNAQENENIEQDENPEMDEDNSNSTEEAPLEESENFAQDHYNDIEIDSEDENNMEIDSEDEDTSIEHSAATDTIKSIVNETLGLGEPTASSTKIDSHQVILDAENEQDLKQSQKIVKKITKIHEENKQGRKEIKKEITILNQNLENLNKNLKKTPKKKVTKKRYTVKKSHKTRYSSPYANRYTQNSAYGVSSSYVNAYAPFQNEQLYVSKSQNGQMPQLYVVRDYNHIKSYGYSYPKKRTQTQKYFNSKCKTCGK